MPGDTAANVSIASCMPPTNKDDAAAASVKHSAIDADTEPSINIKKVDNWMNISKGKSEKKS